MESKKRSDKKCALCKNKWKGDGPMFKVPTDEHTREEWEDACKLTFRENAAVCAAHFKEEEDYTPNWRNAKRKRLNLYAVPSRLLPVTDGHKFIAVGTNTFERKFVKSIYKGGIFRAERSSNIPLAPPEKSASSGKIFLPMLRSTGINTDRITKVTTDVQTDVTYLDKRTCGFICLKRTGIVLNLFLCCLVCTEQYELHDYVNFGIHIGTAHTFEECFESDLNMKENWPLAKDAKAILQPRSEESLKPSIEQNEYEEIEELFIEPVDIENENVSPKENTDNSTQNPDIETKSVEETTPPIEYDELPFTDNETDSDSESEPNPLKFDHCYTHPLINKIKTYRSRILKDLVEYLKHFPPLWYLRKASESAYDCSIKTLCKLLNCRWDINLSEENLVRTVEGIKTWYRSLIMYTHVKTVTDAVICGDEYFKYYVYCSPYLPPTEEGRPPLVECPKCYENCDDYANLYAHCFEQHGIYRSGPYICELCRKQLKTIDEAIVHFNKTHYSYLPRPIAVKYANTKNNQPKTCKKCNQYFYHQEVYDFHLHQHAEKPQNFVCEVCDESFAIESSYALHRNRAHNMSCFVCTICNKEYEKGTPYNMHMKKHRVQFEFLCHVCGMMFLHKPNLIEHLECCHGTRANCDICNIGFRGLGSLQKHQGIFHLVLEGTNEDLELQQLSRTHWKQRNVKKKPRIATRKYERVNEDRNTKKFQLKCPMCDKIYRQHFSLFEHLKKIHNVDHRELPGPKIMGKKKAKRATCNFTFPEKIHTIDYLNIPFAMPNVTDTAKDAEANCNKSKIETQAAVTNMLQEGVVVIENQILVTPNIRTKFLPNDELMEVTDEEAKLPNMPPIEAVDDNINKDPDSNKLCEEVTKEERLLNDSSRKESDACSRKTPESSLLTLDTPSRILSMPLLQSPEHGLEGSSRHSIGRSRGRDKDKNSSAFRIVNDLRMEDVHMEHSLFTHDIDDAEFQIILHTDDFNNT